MATVSFTAFLPEVLPLVPGCADIVAVNAIRNACIEFCAGAAYWQETQDVVDVVDTDFPYDLEGVAGALVTQVLSVSVDGRNLPPTTADALDLEFNDWRSMYSSVPRAYYQPNSTQFALFPLPDTPVSVTLRVAYRPTRASTTVDEAVYQDYLEEIASGALARLCAQPGYPWSSPELAVFHKTQFAKGISAAAIDANKSFTRAPVLLQMQPFA